MKFRDIIRNVETLSVSGDAEITGIAYDSRKVKPGFLFLAMRGESSDGNRFIDAALRAGASAIVTDSDTTVSPPNIAFAQVAHGRQALAKISANFYGRPADHLKLTGVTGTNGKTTTTFVVEHILRTAGRSVAMIGTIEYHVAGRVLPAPHTTPESLELNATFAEAVHAGATEAVMEVSSHALEQGRVYGLHYDVAVFTNLTRDHLDYHQSMEAYLAAKAKLFQGDGAAPPAIAVINQDDEYGVKLREIAQESGSEVIGYGLHGARARAENIVYSPTGTRFDLRLGDETIGCESRLIGEINVYNVLAASAAAYARGCALDQIRDAIASFTRVPGRFERIDCGQPFIVVVDYAHTDDALRNLTRIARQLLAQQKSEGRIITLFGCGGDRDRTKRPLMARAAGEGSDFVVLTSDNPRSEDPLAIIADALPGLTQTGSRHVVEPDRRKAIGIAINEARSGDIVLIAGKGHEKYQITRAGTFSFDDVQVAREALAQVGYQAAREGAPVA
ncbi:MAG TPA: UDP-N-acetylmuramoyl-L-alanyl-D-glutamate--2,6-diaminopimelate ligase [Terriglobales bacterium]|nr:UDP-N-acetylmuramoyl-L-alanyl-D-glutamate--2,6-diaminopimelate ligase [Terriglobales bacterium]